jgi:uncharacterized membrane protein
MGDVETLARGDDSRLVEPRRFLIRDRQAFRAVWAAHAGQDVAVPAVDFESRMVAAVFAGERPTPGFAIEVTGARRDDGELVILVDERRPDPASVAAQVLVSPFHIVTLPRDDGEIRFSLPDPGGSQTIVFKPPARKQASGPLRAQSLAVPGAAVSMVGEAARGEVSDHTGLTPHVAASLAYLAGPFSGALLLATEPASQFVRFHAWQSVLGLGGLGMAALVFLALAFVLLVVSPTVFWLMLWIAAATGTAWLVVWGVCVFNAYRGRVWRLPLAGYYAERMLWPPTTVPASEVP